MRVPGGPYGQIADDFAQYVKTGDEKLVKQYGLKDLRLALSGLTKHRDKPFYEAMKYRIEDLKDRQKASNGEAMAKPKGMGVFITWSGDYSRSVAELLAEWLKRIIPGIDPFISTQIEKDEYWVSTIVKRLETSAVGIACVVPDNREAPWLLYESGALRAGCCVLVIGMQKEELKPPLSVLRQATEFAEEDMLLLATTINKRIENSILESELKTRFDASWPELKENIEKLEVPVGAAQATEAAPRPDIRVVPSAGVSLDSLRQPVDVLDVRVQNHSAISAFLGMVSFELKSGESFLITKDSLTHEFQRRRELQGGEAFSIHCTKEVFADVDPDELVCASITDDIGRVYKSSEESLRSVVETVFRKGRGV